ncbi:tryptophan synthase subunit alpha [Marixanthomonas spongiae]|uniref:Tryptophan synthase alpha chain n=1 Tax=Marixanthomonas spongiae TaxID=2174845 RepID=A0A2U0I788_9FLAO|nr:tryptophan synthase subunit alpha [Marixanthomonas spongiae]PVW16973.1 tryptophan synthase subunit alpha [Marixanthomonas spongiae]
MKRLQETLQQGNKLLSIYFTAGYPNLEDTIPILKALEKNGVDMVEIGLPFSDPLADGPTIQASSTQALKNGMTTEVLFDQLKGVREQISIPLIIMGYFNPVLQYGVEAFCKKCADIGIDGLILPDLPLAEYNLHYRLTFEKYNLANIFLITPQTSVKRIMEIDKASNAFIYMVSSASTTGKTSGFNDEQIAYFNRIEGLQLKNPQIVGFGINNAETFNIATKYAKGAIIGSAFIKALTTDGIVGIHPFINRLR